MTVDLMHVSVFFISRNVVLQFQVLGIPCRVVIETGMRCKPQGRRFVLEPNRGRSYIDPFIDLLEWQTQLKSCTAELDRLQQSSGNHIQ